MKCSRCDGDRIRSTHCDGQAGSTSGVTWGCPRPGDGCHLAVLCLQSENQWTMRCTNHAGAVS